MFTTSAPLILASASPRRHALLKALGVAFEIVITDAEERDDAVPQSILDALPAFSLAQPEHPTLLAWRKAQDARDQGHEGVIIGADTIVVLDSTVLGKPKDAAHARAMLAQLAGRKHTVYTGIAVLSPTAPPLFDLVAAQVVIAPLDQATIAEYVASGEPLDKAGSYGIQGLGGRLVEHVEGSFTTVVGLPLAATAHLLQQAEIAVPHTPEQAWMIWRQTLAKEPLCIHKSMY